ncbi:hypothetical protein AALP_AA6G292600 [Arabis alpina]|uniref:DUF4057 domain-containing protein n=1 Tax=Arabis alpina TaxID=50452 RepID=A0A087GSH7_ARAAL|nr:hypothetical protein AALP_AA6G292600 [Arabis alpina]
MERRNVPVNNPHHSTADLLSWSEIHHPHYSSAANRSNQPSDGIGDVLDGSQITNDEAESLNKNISYRKNCSEQKLKEMSGSDLFSDNGRDEPIHKTINHYHQDQHNQISFSGEENMHTTPKKLTTLTEAAKQKELSRTVQTEDDSKSKKKQVSNAKTKAISGHDIFASPLPPVQTEEDLKSKKQISNTKTKAIGSHDIFASPLPPESQPRRFLSATKQEIKGNKNNEDSAPRNLRASVKASNGQSGNRLFSEEHVVKSTKKIHDPRVQQLTSNGIFKSDKIPPGYSEKMHSSAKLREMSGHNIFADGKSEYRDYYGGARRPPGGESSISLV